MGELLWMLGVIGIMLAYAGCAVYFSSKAKKKDVTH